MKEGFYKLEDGELLYAPNFVSGPGFELLAELRENYSYPVEGWTWFDSLEGACDKYVIDIKEYQGK